MPRVPYASVKESMMYAMMSRRVNICFDIGLHCCFRSDPGMLNQEESSLSTWDNDLMLYDQRVDTRLYIYTYT